MKIGIDARFYGPKHAGLGRYTKNLVDQLARVDTKNEYIVFLHTSNFDEFTTDNPRFTKREVSAGHYSVKEQLSLPKILAKENLDLMHFPHLNVPIGYRGKYVVTIHDLIMHKFKNRAVTTKIKPVYEAKHLAYRLVTRWAATHAAAIIVPSNAVKNELAEFYKLDSKKVTVTYEAADDVEKATSFKHDASTILEKYKITKPFIMYVGNVYPHKNIELLAKAMKELHHRFGLYLVLPSARSIFLQRTEQMMRDNGVRDWVVTPGYVPDEDLRVLYSQAEAYVFPSLSEGFGLPPLEAMVAGLPVVCSDIPVLREICADAALYFDPYDPLDLIKQIGKLSEEKGLREELIKRGQKRQAQFSWKTMAEETLNIYKQVSL